MAEEDAPADRCAPETREERIVARPGADRLADPGGPLADRERAVAGGDLPLVGGHAVCRERRADAVIEHPGEHAAGIGRELKLEQLVPHLLLRAAEVGQVADECERAREEPQPEAQQLVDGLGRLGAVADVVAEID